MNTEQTARMKRAADSAVQLLTQIEGRLTPIAMLNLPLSAADVRAVLELVRDARAPLRYELSGMTIILPAQAQAKR